jgi:putative hydrolase of the HAD superfamily
MNSIEVIFFDLFFTLITPKYDEEKSENDVLGMTQEEWEVYAEDEELYFKRAIGKVNTSKEIIDDIVSKIPMLVSEFQKDEILCLREIRMKNALINVDTKILEVLSFLKDMGKRLCLISNADIIDVMHWKSSNLAVYFEDAIFSYEVGYLKPSPEIYEIAMKRMNVKPEQCIFIGDGGSDELKGAKKLGMKTLLTEYLGKKDTYVRENIMQIADFYVSDFIEIKKCLV